MHTTHFNRIGIWQKGIILLVIYLEQTKCFLMPMMLSSILIIRIK
nr:MAG TPA: hypothetical protein [Caudoviricetes sp.]